MKMNKTMMALAAFSLLVVSGPAFAQEKYGVLDSGKVLRTADAAKGALEELEAKRKSFQSQVEKEEAALRNFEQSVMKEREKLSKEELEKKTKEFQEKIRAAQKKVQDQKAILDGAFADAMGKLRKEILEVTESVAKENGMVAVFNQEAVVILNNSKLDITDEVIEGVNNRVKKISINYSKK